MLCDVLCLLVVDRCVLRVEVASYRCSLYVVGCWSAVRFVVPCLLLIVLLACCCCVFCAVGCHVLLCVAWSPLFVGCSC